jgi:hypothetical protein
LTTAKKGKKTHHEVAPGTAQRAPNPSGMAGWANQGPLFSETSGSRTAKTLADAWNARRVVLANEATIVKICIGFSRARQRFSWVMNGHFAHVSSGGEKRPKDRPRSVDGVNLEFFSRSRFRKSEKISITLPFW